MDWIGSAWIVFFSYLIFGKSHLASRVFAFRISHFTLRGTGVSIAVISHSCNWNYESLTSTLNINQKKIQILQFRLQIIMTVAIIALFVMTTSIQNIFLKKKKAKRKKTGKKHERKNIMIMKMIIFDFWKKGAVWYLMWNGDECTCFNQNN